jgi:hypothetical protein
MNLWDLTAQSSADTRYALAFFVPYIGIDRCCATLVNRRLS